MPGGVVDSVPDGAQRRSRAASSADRRHGKRSRCFPAPLPRDHLDVGGLDVPPERGRCRTAAQRRALRGQPRAIARQQRRRRRQPQRQRLVLGEAGGDQLRQADGAQQAAGDAARECASPCRSAPAGPPTARRWPSCARCTAACRGRDRPARCRARCASGGSRGANTSRSGATPRARRLAPQVARRRRVVLEQPQHAALDAREQPHPDVEHRRRDLVVVVEAAEHEARLRQARLRARRRRRGDGAPAVVGLVAVGQAARPARRSTRSSPGGITCASAIR